MSEAFRLSQQQLQIWRCHTQLMEGCSQWLLRLEGTLDQERLQSALDQLVQQHEIFATRFKRIAGVDTPLQVLGEAVIAWRVAEAEFPSDAAAQEQALAQLRAESVIGNDEDSATLIAVLYPAGEQLHYLALHCHPMALDGSSMALVCQQLASAYAADDVDESTDEEAEILQYIDVSEHHYELLDSEEADAGRLFWQQQGIGARFRHRLMIERPRREEPPPADSRLCSGPQQELDAELLQRLEHFAEARDSTPEAVLFALWQLLLFRLSDQSSADAALVLGQGLNGRMDEEMESVLGLLNRVLPVRAKLSAATSLNQLLQANRQQRDDLESWQECFEWRSLVDVQAKNAPLTGEQLYLPLAFEAYRDGRYAAAGVNFSIAARHQNSDRYHLRLRAAYNPDCPSLRLNLDYDSHCFDPRLIDLLSGQLLCLLDAALGQPDQAVAQLRLLPAEQEQRIITDFNAVGRAAPDAPTIHQMIEAQVARTPTAPALECAGQQLSYAQINAWANQVARQLQAQGLSPGGYVGVYAERSLSSVVAILAIFKAGGIYVPLDREYPLQRLEYILDDAQVQILITSPDQADPFAQRPLQRLQLGAPPSDLLENVTGANLDLDIAPSAGAYLIYTSGSTGNPKGTRVSHDALAWHCASARQHYALNAADKVLLFAPFNFDPSLEQCLPPLSCGACVVVRPGETWDVSEIAHKIESLGLTVVNFPTSYWHLLVRTWQAQQPKQQCKNLRLMISGGDKMLPDAVQRWHSLGLDQVRLLNAYGPTETTVTASSAEDFSLAISDYTQLPIGRPFPNRRMYVLDEQLRPLPVGLVGELYIAGKSLADGYLHQPALTAERFIDDPFAADGSKMYKTGDRAFYAADGQLYFLGRVDTQVKIRGFRVEPLETERVLHQADAVKEAAIVVRQQGEEGGENQLVACCVCNQGAAAESTLKSYLSARLPEYMVPGLFIFLDQLPLTPSGKIDRQQLTELAQNYRDSDQDYVAPQTATEEKLAALWCGLLERDRVSRSDNFMELGGHSLLTMRLSALVREQFHVDFRLADIFSARDLAQLAQLVDQAAASGSHQEVALVAVDKSGLLPLSYAQEALWFLDSLGQKAQYKLTGLLRLDEALELERVQQALDLLVQRHDSLRACFVEENGKPMQRILPQARVAIEQVKLADSHNDSADAYIKTWNQQPFDLSQAPLLRVLMLQHPDGRQVLAFTVHHIISDGLSTPILLRDFSAYYSALLLQERAEAAALPPLSIQYPDYAVWQRQTLTQPVIDGMLNYWREQLAGYQNLAINNEKQRNKTLSGQGQHLEYAIDSHVDQGVQQICRQLNIGQTSFYISVVYLLLKQFAQSPDFCLGMATADRDRVELENVVGMLLNTLVLRFKQHQDELSLREFLLAGQNTVREAVMNQLPFEKIVDGLQPDRSVNINPFFQATVTYFESDKTVRLGDRTLLMESFENNSSNFELSFDFSRDPQGQLSLILEYSTDLFSSPFIDTLVATLMHMLAQLPQHLDTPLGRFDYLPDAAALQHSGAGAQRDFTLSTGSESGAADLLSALRQGLSRHPDKRALSCLGESLSYGQLQQRVDSVTVQLQQLGVAPGDSVAVALERGLNSPIAALAVVQAGGVYVPIDPQLPRQRIDYMLQDCGAQVLILDLPSAETLAEAISAQAQVVILDEAGYYLEASQGQAPQPLSVGPESPAYLIYTSGSTGQPKGVLVPHRALFNLLHAMAQAVGFGTDDKLLAVATTSFDMSIPDLFMPALFSAELVMADQDSIRNVRQLATLIDSEAPSIMQATPILWEMLFDCGWTNASATKMVSGGEAPSRKLLDYIQRYGCRAFNGYGPTETTVYACFKALQPGQPLSIGRPIANYQFYVLDAQRRLAPPGALGELYIAGPGLALGYSNQPELTAAAFVDNPFFDPAAGQDSATHSKLYKTGDLVHWQDVDGEQVLICHGRADEQIKLRGFRIELSEIEAALHQLPEVSQVAVVVSQATGVPQLLACYVATSGATLDLHKMRHELAQRLPSYMIPSRLLALDRLPLNDSNKVDKRALLELEQSLPAQAETSASAGGQHNATQARLLAIWQELFGHPDIGLNDDFFDLGGHSLLFVELQLQVNQEFGVDVGLDKLFDTPVLSAMAELIDGAVDHPERAIDPNQTPAQARLSYNQQGLWLSDRIANGSSAYNMLFALQIDAALDVAVVEQALNRLQQRHSALRTVIEYRDGQALQQVVAGQPVVVQLLDQRTLPRERLDAALQECLDAEAARVFNLSSGPLWQVNLIQQAEERYVLVLNLHHICADGWSMRILIREFSEIYQSLSQGQPPQLAQLPVQYIDFAHWQRQQIEGGGFEPHLHYWREQLQGARGITALPLDHPRDATHSPQAEALAVSLDQAQCDALREFVRLRHGSLFNLMLAAYQLLLAIETGERDILIGTDVANRARPELEGVVGFFTSQLPVRSRIDFSLSVADYLDQLTQQSRELLVHQDAPLEWLMDQLKVERISGLTPLFQSKFYMDVVPKGIYATADSQLTMTPLSIAQAAYRTDLSLGLTDDGEVIAGNWVYNARLFNAATIQRLARRFNQLLSLLSGDGAMTLEAVQQALAEQERQQQLHSQQQLMANKLKDFKPRRRGHDDSAADRELNEV